MKKRAIGLELTDHAMILCEVAREHGIIRVKRQEVISLPPDVIMMGELKDPATLSQLISSVLSNPLFAPAPLMVSISGLHALIRRFSIPLVPEREIAQVVHWEGENILPYPIIEVFYHYQVTGQTDTRYQILFTAHRRERVESYLQLFHDMDLSVRLLTIHPFGLVNYLESTGQLHQFDGILARLRPLEFEIVLFYEGEIMLVRTVASSPMADGQQDFIEYFLEELTSTLEHMHTESGLWLHSGLIFGSSEIVRQVREAMPSFHWRHFYPRADVAEVQLYKSSHEPLGRILSGKGFRKRHHSTHESVPMIESTVSLLQELPCAFGLAMLGVTG